MSEVGHGGMASAISKQFATFQQANSIIARQVSGSYRLSNFTWRAVAKKCRPQYMPVSWHS
jgi:hypothetical protein